MMTNLFSTFDPSTSLISLNWLSSFLGIIMLPSMFWLIPSYMNLILIKTMKILHQEFKILLKNSSKGSTMLFISLFMMIMFNNFMGLFPYIFTSSSHISMTLSLALPLWVSFMLFGWINNYISMMSHLVPMGTPMILMPFMVCIETISNLIRPGTLAIRLSANMIAGHLLIILLSSTSTNLSILMLIMMMMIQIMLMILETAVSMIQAYVFSILSTLYSSETN